MRTIYIGNLPDEMDERYLRATMARFGRLGSVRVVTHRRTGQPRRFAFVDMHSTADAGRAVEELNGFVVAGRTLEVAAAAQGFSQTKPRTG